MAMDSTLKLDPSCVFFNDSVLSYTSMGPPTLSTTWAARSTFRGAPGTALAQISVWRCGERARGSCSPKRAAVPKAACRRGGGGGHGQY